MKFVLHPWQLLLLILAGLINQKEQNTIAYLRTENRILREKLGKKRILLNDEQPRLLAVKGKILGRKMLEQITTIVTAETILRWHRELLAVKWDYSRCRKKIGRPPVSVDIRKLVLRMAEENPNWGYDRIQGAPANLGHMISNTCVAGILKAHGIDPAPDRKRQSTWKNFLQAHWEVLASVDFAVSEFLTHYHQERNHQGLNNQLLQPNNEVVGSAGDVACQKRLGGMLHYYYRQKAA